MGWDRKRRLDAKLLEKIAVIVQQRLHDPRLGFITITDVELSRDRRDATVKYTVLGDDAARRRTAITLKHAAPHVQELLGPTLHTRHLPRLTFVYDESVEKESRMLDLLEGLASERAERDGPEEAEGCEQAGAEPGSGEPADGGA